jgi:hypothetical protein
MLTSRNTGGFAATSAPEGFDLDDFERAGLRAVERRFAPKDNIFTPGDPGALAKRAASPSGLSVDGQLPI